MEFKNSFAWLTGIKKQFFYHIDFSDSGHFLVTFLRFDGLKNSQSQKNYLNKKSVYHARQPGEGIFELHSCCGLIFMAVFGNFDQLVLTHQTFFQKKFGFKSLLLVSTISDQMWTEIRQPQSNSNVHMQIGIHQNHIGTH